MIQDIESSGRCVARINAFWRKLGVSVEAHVGRDGEIQSRLTNGLPPVRLSQSAVGYAVQASGALKPKWLKERT